MLLQVCAMEAVLSPYPGGQVYKRRVQCGLESRQPSKKDFMLTSLAKHSFGAILLVVLIEEVGIPLPIPSDFLVIFAGTMTDRSLPRLVLFTVALTMASAVGASGLYAIARRGGRPLVERFGRYVHLGPEQLDRAEALLSRSGWGGIAIGRATPGLRYATVIACGLLEVSYPRFVSAPSSARRCTSPLSWPWGRSSLGSRLLETRAARKVGGFCCSPRPRASTSRLRGDDLRAAAHRLGGDVHVALVAALPTEDLVLAVAVVDVDQVEARAALYDVAVALEGVGVHLVVAALQEDPVLLAVAHPLVDQVVVAGGDARHPDAVDYLVVGLDENTPSSS